NICIGVMLMGAGLAQLVADVPLTPAEIAAKMLSFAILTLVAGGLLATLYRAARNHPSTVPTHHSAGSARTPSREREGVRNEGVRNEGVRNEGVRNTSSQADDHHPKGEQ
ncbi:MAG TPA: hypothetical protein VES02_05380, partial [Dermatophilaceae bacterium]|nr:hypothetical protein [Dermatophilaceae bacterium]